MVSEFEILMNIPFSFSLIVLQSRTSSPRGWMEIQGDYRDPGGEEKGQVLGALEGQENWPGK